MKLDVSKALKLPGEEFPFEARLALPQQDIAGDTVSFDEVSLTGVYSAVGESVVLEGTMRTAWYAPCCRCLKTASAPMELPFREQFQKNADEDEGEAFRFEGNQVPLDQMALTVVLLALPMRFLCREGCEGSEELRTWELEHSAPSEARQAEHPFEALRNLLTKDEEV